jgi:hypothetical protein
MGNMPQRSPCSVKLAIGGVDLIVHGDSMGHVSEEDPYESFLRPCEEQTASSSAIDIAVLAEPAPRNVSPSIFEAGGAWTMQPEQEGYRLSFQREGGHAAHTVVCSDADTTRVRAYVDQDHALDSPALEPDRTIGWIRVGYPVDQLLLMNHLAKLGGIIVHSAGAVLGGEAVVFAGTSGAGKSTISRLFMAAGLGGSLLSDDRVIIRTSVGQDTGHGTTAWGTPWPGDAGVARNAAAPLAAVLFLVKSDITELRALSVDTAAKRLMPVVTCPWYDTTRLPHVLDACSRVVERTPCYDLLFRPDAEVVELVTGFDWGGKGRRT